MKDFYTDATLWMLQPFRNVQSPTGQRKHADVLLATPLGHSQTYSKHNQCLLFINAFFNISESARR